MAAFALIVGCLVGFAAGRMTSPNVPTVPSAPDRGPTPVPPVPPAPVAPPPETPTAAGAPETGPAPEFDAPWTGNEPVATDYSDLRRLWVHPVWQVGPGGARSLSLDDDDAGYRAENGDGRRWIVRPSEQTTGISSRSPPHPGDVEALGTGIRALSVTLKSADGSRATFELTGRSRRDDEGVWIELARSADGPR